MTDDRMETITDPAEIRATDDPDERTTPAPVGAAVALDLDAAHVRTDPACTFHDGATPKASRGKSCPACMRLDLDALHETICDKFTGMAEVRQAADLLVAEVRRLAALCIPLTDLAQELDLSRQNLHHSRAMSSAHFERAEREKAQAFRQIAAAAKAQGIDRRDTAQTGGE